MPKISDEKVALKKVVQIDMNFVVLSMYVILFSISAWILMNASFFCTTAFNSKLFFCSEQIRDLQRILARHYTSFMYNFRGSAKSLVVERRYKKVNTAALERWVLNSLFLLIKTTYVANDSIKVGKLNN